MPEEVISKETRSNLELLKKANVLDGFYLAGGTGLALQIKHRFSIDLDFFTEKDIDIDSLKDKLNELGVITVEKEAKNTLNGTFNGTEIMFLKYAYPLLFPLQESEGITIADIRDIGCMKISAVSSRGSKKDFIDLFFICKNVLSLEELLELFKKKYKDINYNMVHIRKSLVYFENAEKDPIPKMLIPANWVEVKSFFQRNVK